MLIESDFDSAEETPLEEGENEYKFLVIDGPMLVFITKETKKKKYIVAAYYLTENVFLNPKLENF